MTTLREIAKQIAATGKQDSMVDELARAIHLTIEAGIHIAQIPTRERCVYRKAVLGSLAELLKAEAGK